MNVYESLAHVLIQEHGRNLFLGRHHSNYNSIGNKFWRWLLLVYGRELYNLPRKMALPDPEEVSGLARKYGFPAFTLVQSMRAGISPLELYSYPSMGGFDHTYTPVHVGTALLKFGVDQGELAKKLMDPEFLKATYPHREATSFAQNSDTNPYRPADFGLQPINTESFIREDLSAHVVDELGNAAWFSVDYVKQVLRMVPPAHWYGKLCELHSLHGLWGAALEKAALSLLSSAPVNKHSGHKNHINYIRGVSAESARFALKKCDGVREVLWIARSDTTPKEMAKGLRVLTTTSTGPVQEARQYIGRALTLEDFAELTPRQALSVLYYAPYGAVEEVIAKNSEELSAMFFTLTTKEHLPMVSNSMSKHNDRSRNWYPDTIEGNLKALMRGTPEEIRKRWDDRMGPLVSSYERNKEWRDRYLMLAEPAVLFLALMRWKSTDKDPVPIVTIDNLLRAHHNIVEVQRTLEEMPADVTPDSAL